MLRLKGITKSYTTAGFTQNALDGVSIAFRDNEFAAVLGPSGSGKTTMLNIIGGLDRYDSGDLEIDTISTKNYKASDWDTYRNNRIGFVFQSYNLIPHQTVLANVELALTLSGVSRRERRKRAIQALDRVGLKDHIRKKPGQMSGGQMQRVAIARALINAPEILLADEPTGALDTTTSKQVMELLTEIAKDRLVIMVTHNNELAEEYANRIVQLTDGKVKSDTRHYDPASEDWRVGKEPRRASMSFLTAIMLSFSNLMTKKGRTITTAFAGSIGIIGIATILALSNGINEYIRNIEEETLSIYPLAIQDQGFDLSGFFGGNDEEGGGGRHREPRPDRPEGIREMPIMENVFATQSTNDLASLKTYFQENEQRLDRYASTIHYMYDIVPQIYLADTSEGIDQINPDSIFSNLMGGQDAMGGGMGFMPSMNVFLEMPNNPVLYENQYDVVTGHWPSSFDEAVLVVSHGERLTDFALYSMGLRDRSEMRAMLEAVMNRSEIEIEIEPSQGVFSYDMFLNLSFKVVHPAELYQFDDLFDVWVDKSGDTEFMEELLAGSMDLKIVGIVKPREDATTTVLGMGVNYTPELILHLMESAAGKRIVRQQLDYPDVNVLSGRTFDDEKENPDSAFDFSRIISIDEEMFRNTLDFEDALSGFDMSGMDFSGMDMSSFDMSGMNLGSFDLSGLDMSGMDFSNIDLSGMDMGSLDLSGMTFDTSGVPFPAMDINALMAAIMGQVNPPDNLVEDISTALMQDFLLNYLPAFTPPLPDFLTPEQIFGLFAQYMDSIGMQLLEDMLETAMEDTDLGEQLSAAISEVMAQAMASYMEQLMGAITLQMQAAISSAMQGMMQQAMAGIMSSISLQMEVAMQRAMRDLSSQISKGIQSSMTQAMSGITDQIQETIQEAFDGFAEEMQASMDIFDAEALADAFQIELGEEEIFELMMSIMNPSETNFEQTLHMLGYADPNVPAQILIYPRSFEAKQSILDILDDYNARMEREDPDKVIHYTDIVGLMMSTVTDIVDMVSYALVAFVSVALVVSSIMIGVITFISVLERKKEIGILRAVGASKGNIRLVFNAETLIIGFVAGVIGVFATFGIIIIANIILYNELGIVQLVVLPPLVPLILIAISMFLTYIAGLLPASAAASKAPVEALRSE
ncbi:MAG: ATP-binding cassette domain-containing protein [Oscillospiraceae bacterium]|nr:ATP-binding cassette domain-containing protein [Oscillospiraceae bacterium]